MPLTRFGKACQEHRRARTVVMGDQSVETGYSVELISGIERGTHDLPAGYLERLAEWLELNRDDVAELALLATLGPTAKRGRGSSSEETLASILDRLEVDRPNKESVNEEH